MVNKPTRLFLAGVLAVGLILAATALVRSRGAAKPPIVILPNGISYRFAGTTYGTNHVMGSRLLMQVEKLPRPLAALVRRALGSRLGPSQRRTTAEPTMVVWFEPLATNQVATTAAMHLVAMLADESTAFSGVSQDAPTLTGAGTPYWLHPGFQVVPRRSRMLYCALFEYLPNGKWREVGRVSFPNPLFGHFPEWQPEPLPVSHPAGDLLVTLDYFHTGHGNSSGMVSLGRGRSTIRSSAPQPGQEVRAAFKVHFESPRGTNEVWTLHNQSVSDATGNLIRSTSRSSMGTEDFLIGPVLWPGETWRLQLELKRSAGFAPEELLVFRGVRIPAVGESNQPSLSATAGGLTVTLKEVLRRPDITGNSWSSERATSIRFEHAARPEGVSLDIVSLESSDGVKLQTLSQGWSDSHYEISLRAIPPGVESVDITFAVQKTRSVEFLVRPYVSQSTSLGPEP